MSENKRIKDSPKYELADTGEYIMNEASKKGMISAIGFIEMTYPETAKEFKRLQEEQYELFCNKQMDLSLIHI